MADSEEKKPVTPSDNAAGSTSLVKVITKNQHGTITERLRDPITNKFVAKPKPLIPSIEFKRIGRKKLSRLRDDGLTEYAKTIECLIERAHYDGPDAKMAMVQMKAAELLELYLLGKPSMSDDDKDALKTQGIKTIFVDNSIVSTPVQEERVEKEKKVPSFAEVTGVVTNQK